MSASTLNFPTLWRYPYTLKRPRLPGKTVYIVGSGLNFPLGIPVMQNFIHDGIKELARNAWNSKTPDRKRKSLEKTLESIRNIVNIQRRVLNYGDAQPTMEDLCSLVHLAGTKEQQDDVSDFIRQVCLTAGREWDGGWKFRKNDNLLIQREHFITQSAHETAQLGPSSMGRDLLRVDLYESFLSQLRFPSETITCEPRFKEASPDLCRNAIVTFNYDTVFEDVMKRLESRVGPVPALEPYYGSFSEGAERWNICGTIGKKSRANTPLRDNQFPIIKIHGSINWVRHKRRNPEEHWVEKNDPAIERKSKASDHFPVILPSWQRSDFNDTVYEPLVRNAIEHLRLASRWVFIGYSLPMTDLSIRYLLKVALDSPQLPEIEVCLKEPGSQQEAEEAVKKRMAEMLGRNAANQIRRGKVFHEGFESYVKLRKENEKR